ncbi:Delta-1-pyrroline-5-carboxylate dehydrogenase [Actinokineospora spheciospongiae]|uniref:L-glutamate gamma-semialdehyde dehydrogenase n=1 Tax=Actinokineospora spheciospongiae TaxID=909613 RepID=W7IW17_9PSEU|nr:L-glutamate gamma-semialdehyde dehydrogenase [Actinokineospora spheciospongiae]EWC58184.1 Delta-1-pyrroline-5-carboxylate dehydrogenase [Actinokineospora spheciospongiae]PWW64609.1 delta-1-pyrroline-5-carboxylate dehydrogenase [Actinokineospora spheciospongiae]
MDAVTSVPTPINEPIGTYAPGSPARESLAARIAELEGERAELTMTIGGRRRMAAGDRLDVVQPHDHRHVLGVTAQATHADVADAVTAAKQAAPGWRALPFDERAAVLLRAADLLAGPWRDTLNAATILGQSKSAQQAEIDAACELIDFWRYNVAFARRIVEEQPVSAPGTWNRTDHRPLDGFVTAITPFNFTAIAGNLPTAPALMGNTVVWKPSPTQQLAAHFTMRLLEAAGLPPGVINMVTGDGAALGEVALADPDFAGLHFTGSTRTFKHLWRRIGDNLDTYRSYPRIVGETGGKDFVVAHPSADPAALVNGLVRGAFEYQGQKCSAASRAYLPRSLWDGGVRDHLADVTASLSYGDVTDFSHFGGAVIDARAFAKHREALQAAAANTSLEVLAGGTADDSTGYFVQPTVLVGSDPLQDVFTTEYFGPILAVHVYEDADFAKVLELVDTSSPYALTGAVFATDRAAIEQAHRALRFSAGNFYVNDKPTGAVVGQQPFGGGRASGTNDKAGSIHNLQRWVSPRSIKETFVPPTDHRYPHMG